MTSKQQKPLTDVEAERLGAWIAQELGSGPSPEVIAAQRLRLARSSAGAVEKSPAKWWAVGGGVLAAAVVVGGIVVVGKLQSSARSASARHPGISAEPLASQGANQRQQDLSPATGELAGFVWRPVGGNATASNSGAALAAKQWLEPTAQPLRFALGNGKVTSGELEVGPGSRVHVAQVDSKELRLELERGLAQAALAPGASRVVVAAGPYRVAAADQAGPTSGSGATRAVDYSVNWVPKLGALHVEATRGDVAVEVASGTERHLVRAGESLDLASPEASETVEVKLKSKYSSETPKADLRAGESEPSHGARKPTSTSVAIDPEAEIVLPPSANSEVVAPPVTLPPSTWRKFAENGQYAEAVKEAEQVGFTSLEQTATASELLLLADAARLGGAPQRARGVLTALRSRYPGHTNAAVAAFTLGRMAQEQEHDDRRAISWYRTYLKEEPSGRMAEGARARLLKATLRVGSDSEREQAARDYLANHPTGSSAAVARSVLRK
jgi:hypothetical protein